MATKISFIVMDPDGNPWGPFDDAQVAAAWAAKKWPDKEAGDIDEEGWMVTALRSPQ